MSKSTTRLVLIYTGKYKSGTYTKFSTANLNTLSNATGFVISPTTVYDVYKTAYDDYITAVEAQVDEIPSGKSFYIGLPVINATTSYSSTNATSDYTRLKAFVVTMATEYASSSNFKGFYFTNERVFADVSTSAPTSNPMVKLMNDLAYLIRNDPNSAINKEFIWAPYLGYNNSYYQTNQNIGAIVNRTSIFNTVFLQSGYYFSAGAAWNASTRSGRPAQNLALAYQCALKQAVYNYSGNDDSFTIASSPVGSSKNSTTKVGIDMEAEDSLAKKAAYQTSYKTEVAKFGSLLKNGTCPFLFYGGSYNGIISSGVNVSINQFYNDGTYKLPNGSTS